MDYREKMMKRLDHLNDLWMTSALPGVGPGLNTWKRWTLNYPFDIVCEANSRPWAGGTWPKWNGATRRPCAIASRMAAVWMSPRALCSR